MNRVKFDQKGFNLSLKRIRSYSTIFRNYNEYNTEGAYE